MNEICKRFAASCILLDIEERSMDTLLGTLADSLANHGIATDSRQLLEKLLERERLASTCVGCGCAIPHAHSEALSDTWIAGARLTPPIKMDSPDGMPISLVFLIAGPPGHEPVHLRVLSKLARLLHKESVRQKLLLASDTQRFMHIMCEET